MRRRSPRILALACLPVLFGLQATDRPSTVLPREAVLSLTRSVDSARAHAVHVWRDTPPFAGQLANAYVEIPRDDRRKWEFDMAANAREIDRIMPAEIGGYPVNYGFVPQTISYDGDPFDALVLGPPLRGGAVVRGAVVGLMLMEDEKGLDSKVVLSPVGPDGRPTYQLTGADRERIGEFFQEYKKHEAGKFSKVPGWGSAGAGRQHIEVTHAFFKECRSPGGECRLGR